MSNWFTELYREIRPNARWDIIKAVVLGGIGLFSWYTSRSAVFAGIPPILIGIAVFTVLAFAFAAVAFGVSKLRVKDEKPQAPNADPKLHENCERTISNHESTIRRLQDRNETQGIQISDRDSQIQQLQARLQGLSGYDALQTNKLKTSHVIFQSAIESKSIDWLAMDHI